MTGVIERFGALGVFLLMVPESACVPIPSEVTLLFSGFAVHQGWMSFPFAVLAATAGNVAGSLLAYALGASRVLDRVSVLRTVLAQWEGLIERHGARAVFIARLLPLARTFISLPAGAHRVQLGRFVLLTAIGCALWAAGLVLVGLTAASAWTTVSTVLGRATLVIGLFALAVPVFCKRHRRRARSARLLPRRSLRKLAPAPIRRPGPQRRSAYASSKATGHSYG